MTENAISNERLLEQNPMKMWELRSHKMVENVNNWQKWFNYSAKHGY